MNDTANNPAAIRARALAAGLTPETIAAAHAACLLTRGPRAGHVRPTPPADSLARAYWHGIRAAMNPGHDLSAVLGMTETERAARDVAQLMTARAVALAQRRARATN